MRTRLEPRTWLLAAVAAWAAIWAAVALSGFGGRVDLLPDNPALARPIQAVPTAGTHSALKPLEAYSEAYNRPLFYPDRKPIAVHVPGQDPNAAQPLDVALTSVIMTPTLQMAIVEDPKTRENYRVREGQSIGGTYGAWKLTGLSPRQATFDSSQGQSTLDLRIFDGRGGEEPTRTGLTPQAIASGILGPPRPPVTVAAATPDPSDAADQPDPEQPDNTAANEAASRAAAEASQQAEQIRRRIEQRRLEAQSQRAASNNKDR